MTPATGSVWGYAWRAFAVGVGGLFVLTLLATLLVLAALALRDGLERAWRRRARRRFTREAVRLAEQRRTEQAARQRAREAQLRADEERMWADILAWPELGRRQ